MKRYYVYILTNDRKHVLYTGVTDDLNRRVNEHRTHVDPQSFTARYDIGTLIYYEEYGSIRDALEREKQIKSWRRAKKMTMITEFNPRWEELMPREE